MRHRLNKHKIAFGFLLSITIVLLRANIQRIKEASLFSRLKITTVREVPMDEIVYASGKVRAQKSITIYAVTSGVVQALKVQPGDTVHSGQVLLKIFSPELEERMKDLEMEITRYKLEFYQKQEEREKELIALENEYAAQKLAFSRAELEEKNAETNYRRYERLYNAGAVTRKELEEAANQLEISRINLQNALAILEKTEKRLAESKRAVEEDQNGYYELIEMAKMRLAEIRSRIEAGTILAPFTGVVARLEVQNGKVVTPGEALLTINDLSGSGPLEVVVSVNELDLPKLAAGQKARLTSQAIEGKSLKGWIKRIAPEIEQVGTAPSDTACEVVLALENGNKLLRPGMAVDAAIIVATRRVLAVPARAVVEREGRQGVYVVTGNSIRFTPIRQTGLTQGEWVEIKGLAEGTRIIATPSDDLEKLLFR